MKSKISHTFEEAAKYSREQYRNMTPEQRLELIQILREQWIRLNHQEEEYRASREGLRRVCKVIKRK